jgi:Na+/proline symporter
MLLMTVLGLLFAYAIYISARANRSEARPADFLDAGCQIPSWAYIFAGTGVVLAGLGLPDHLLLVATYGLQYSHVTVGVILVALCGTLVQKRLWLASRITGTRTIGDLMGDYFGSTFIRIYLLFILFLFAVPVAAYCLSEAAALVNAATRGTLPASLVVWALAVFLFLFSVIGGWRGVVYVVAAQSFLVFILILFIGGFAVATFDEVEFLSGTIRTAGGVLADQVPGVVQYTAGIGKEVPAGGIWTAVAILSFSLALIGTVLSPGFCFLGITTASKKAFAFMQVWMTGGIAAGTLLLIGPIIAAEIASGGTASFSSFIARLGSEDQLVAICFVVLLLASLQVAIAFFTASGANISTIELVSRFVLPDLTGQGQRLSARISLALIYFFVALAASIAPLSASIFSSLALSLSVQILPAAIGLCWLSWISRRGVLTGLVFGIILVIFTEPFGIGLFESLFIDLPWGRWPLTVHSAAWGLFFNIGACLLVSLVTRSGEERDVRQRLHDEFRRQDPVDLGGRAAREAKWSLTLIWVFLALGPGAVLGNRFFSRPIFAGGEVKLGVPSLFVWQMVFWLIGVLIVWWLAYRGGMSVVDESPRRKIVLRPPADRFESPATPAWISRLLGRLAER